MYEFKVLNMATPIMFSEAQLKKLGNSFLKYTEKLLKHKEGKISYDNKGKLASNIHLIFTVLLQIKGVSFY